MAEAAQEESTVTTESSLEEDLGAAIDALEEKEETTGAEESGGPEQDAEESVGDAETGSKSDDDTEEEAGATDEGGQAAESGLGASESESDSGDDDEESDASSVSDTPAPVSWSPENREHWGKLPPEVQSQVAKREREIDAGLRESSEARRFYEQFNAATQPFRDTIAVEANGDPLLATRNLMNIATGLRTGAQPQKAQLIAQIIQTYGVDVDTLDQILSSQIGAQSGQAQAPMGQAQPQDFRDPRVDQMLANQQKDLAESQRTVDAAAHTFMTDPANEFAMDVRNDMADLMEMAGRRGQSLSYKEAYDKAVSMNAGIQSVLSGRKQTGDEKERTSLKRKKRASSTISGSPSGDDTSTVHAGSSMSSDVSAAWDSVVGGDT